MDESPCTSPRTTRWADTGLAEISHEQASHKLFRAVMQENISQLAQLLDDGAMLNIVNAANLTPIELAAERGKANSLAFLALRGPDYLKAQYHDFVFHEDDSPNATTGKVFAARRAKIEVEVAATQFELETAEPVEVSRLLQLLELTLKSGGQSRRSIERLLSFTGDFAAAMNSLDTVVYERQANETFGRAKPLVTAALWETLPCPGPGFPRGEMLANDIGVREFRIAINLAQMACVYLWAYLSHSPAGPRSRNAGYTALVSPACGPVLARSRRLQSAHCNADAAGQRTPRRHHDWSV